MRRRGDDRKKWTSFDTLRLISEFESMPFLWNVFDDEYKNKRLKTKAIEKLARVFETSPREINRKLHNLRCQYTGEIRKIRSRAGALDPRSSQWSYFDSLKFLSSVVNVRSAAGNDVMTIGCYEPGRSDGSVAGYPEDGYSEEEAAAHEEGSSQHEMKFNPLELDLLRKGSDSVSDYSDLNEKKVLASEVMKLDDFDIFGKLVATHLRKMPLERAIRCQEKLFTLIMQERLAQSDGLDESGAFSPGFQAPSP